MALGTGRRRNAQGGRDLTKGESEQAIRHLCHKWRHDCGYARASEGDLSFSQFYSWLEQLYPNYLRFQTTASVRDDIEMWFDQEFKQTWRR
jgi:hypothetical protein